MLMKMEDETKIFVGWLVRLIKKDKKIKAKVLAHRIGCDASTISSYVRGRTKPDFETRHTILAATQTPYETMLEIGRRELQPVTQPDILKRLEKLEKKHSEPYTDNIKDFQSLKNQDHHHKINEFKNQNLALKLNHVLVEIEKLDPSALEEIEDILNAKLKALAKKKKVET